MTELKIKQELKSLFSEKQIANGLHRKVEKLVLKALKDKEEECNLKLLQKEL